MSAIPNELWISVFEELDSPRDLANVVSANRRFRSLGTRVLYRHIVWLDPLKFVRNYPFLQHNTHLPPVTRALTLGVSTATPHLERIEQLSRARATVTLSGEVSPLLRPNRIHEARILDDIGIGNPVDLLAAEDVAHTMYNYAQSFTNLRDLTFNSMVLPDSFYDFVHRFPALDRLAIENCTPPHRPQTTHLHPRDLPITELTIVGIRGRRDQRELRAFGEGKHLRVLRFDSTCYIYKHFSDFPPNPPQNNWHQGFVVTTLPALAALAALHTPQVPQPTIPFHQAPVPSPHIHTIDVKFPTQKSWQSYISEPHDQYIVPFTDFLAKCPRTTTLRIRNHLPWLRLPDTALPNLAHFQGPLTTVKSVVSGQRRIKHLTIRDPTGGLAALEKAFKEIEASGCGPELESLSVFIGWWDDEILYAVLHHFNGLKRLEIMYKEGDPSEDMVLGMGAHFFGPMPHLWCVHVFKVISPGTGSVSTPENFIARDIRLRPIRLSLGEEFIGPDGPERTELDDAEFEAAKFGSSSSSHVATWTYEDPEEVVLKELIQAWNRYCPMLREVQLKAGYVWRRANPTDVWTKRPIRVNRARNAGFDDEC